MHTSHRFGGYQDGLNQQMDESLKPLREAHTRVRDLSQHCQGLFDLLLISQTYWHRGYTLPRQLDDDSGTELTLELDAGISPVSELDSWHDAVSMHMLRQAYAIRNTLQERGALLNEYPVLCIPDASSGSAGFRSTQPL